MKYIKKIFVGVCLVSFNTILCQTDSLNYIYKTAYRVGVPDGGQSLVGVDDKIESITYFDGLGRPFESIAHRSGGNGQDVVSVFYYDGQGRQSRQFLPYADPTGTATASLNYQSYEDVFADIESYYLSEYPDDLSTTNPNPYAETLYEHSPLNRALESGAPGEAWLIDPNADSDHTIKFEYSTNAASEVRAYEVTTSLVAGVYVPTLVTSGYYSAGELIKSIVKDENWQPGNGNRKTTQEFKNKLGQVVLKRTFESTDVLDTYYIYDDFGNLTYVLPPLVDTSDGVSSIELDEIGYQYRYDDRNRLVEKKIPGKAWEYIIYDNLDRPVLTQDGNLRADNKWLFTKYDNMGRVAYTGLYTDSSNKSTIVPTAGYETQQTTGTTVGDAMVYYSNSVFPSNNLEVLTVNYYDTYVDIPTSYISQATGSVFGQAVTTATHGLPTVSKIRVLETTDWITSLSSYDDKGRVIQSASYNGYLDTTDETLLQLDFSGQLLYSWTSHTKGTNAAIITKDYFTYDHQGRLKTHLQELNDGGLELIADNSYDELGQLEKKKVGGELFAGGLTDLVNVTVDEYGRIEKDPLVNDNWNAGIATIGKIMDDGGISFTVPQTGNTMIVGLNDVSSSHNFGEIDYAFHFKTSGSNPIFQIRIDNAIISGSNTGYAAGDSFSLERSGTTLYFKHNGVVNYTHTITGGNPPLLGDASFKSTSSAIENLHFYATTLDKVLQEVDYTYNIRGWLKEINPMADLTKPDNTDLWSFKLNYTQIEGDASGTALYNGNIAQTQWQSENDNTKRAYTYTYDDLNRIELAIFREGANLNSSTTIYDNDVKNISYDKNGNILTLDRRGRNISGTINTWWERMTYSYDAGNKLQKVDNSVTSATATAYGFIDGNTGFTNDYTYDVNGNMTQDLNKDITLIEYNHLNLPRKVVFNGQDAEPLGTGKTILYVYDATGVKLEKKVIDTPTPDNTTHYAGGYIYTNDELEFISQPEGYIHPVDVIGGGVEYNYVYQYKDHLGNIRLSYSDANGDGSVNAAEIIEESNYYPFGLKHKGYNNTIAGGNDVAQQWKYNVKEFNEDLGINWYDFGARNYEASLGRWMNVDPLADNYESFSPYNFVANNPLIYYDPDGRQIYTIFYDENGNQVYDIPEQVQQMFNEEYGIVVSYDAETGMLSYAGEIETDKDISEKAKEAWINALNVDNDFDASIVFGFQLGYDKSVDTGTIGMRNIEESVIYGVTNSETKRAFIDLADFDGQEALGEWISEGPFDTRTLNLARIVEHEVIGHAINGLKDPGKEERNYMTGDVIDIINSYRRDLKLTERSDYREGIIHFGKGTNNPHAFSPNEIISEIRNKVKF